MPVALNLADLAFLLTQVKAGNKPPLGTDPLSLIGVRAVDGANNNLTHQIIIDQHGNEVDTATFGMVDQPFFHIVDEDPGSPALDNTYTPREDILDSSPRIISNLVADMSEDNPAYVEVEGSANPATGNPGAPTFFIPPTNSLFTFFGQFFDHGLDFIDKGGSGTIAIPLLPNDENYDHPDIVANMMFVDRATLDGNDQTNNSTAPLVELSQTYGQKSTTLFYLMEYDDGKPTGRLVTHADGSMPTWADIKANALKVGIVLLDEHVLDVPDPAFWNSNTQSFNPGASTGQSFLADIAHTANPANPGYDAALLDAHKIAGDPRANENVALTSIHETFHNEHNRLVALIEDLIQQQDQVTPGSAAEWDGARIFQAAKLINEMQYQHFVFEEFGRRLSPNIDAFAQYDVTINPNISAEFSQAVYRLGHSMLTDTVRTLNAADQVNDLALVDAFLNPHAFDAAGAGALIEGATRQQMNEIDEFVVDSLRNMLVGLPLDLAAINIARGRDVGLPTLNETRQDLFDQTGEGTLAPYTSWTDFGDNILHPESLVNFIAAYARNADIKVARDAGDYVEARRLAQVAIDTEQFENSTDLLADDLGFWDIDLWIGGLAERKVFGPTGAPGMLGTTFDFIFAQQMLALQNGDRFYYLGRLAGTNILIDLEQSVFGDLFERGSGARHTNGDIFSSANEYIELSDLGVNEFTSQRSATEFYMEVVGGTTSADTISTRGGNDTVWGEGGNDTINGGDGNDFLRGGDGNDVINGGNQNDHIRGDAGDDILNGDAGDDLIFGKTGNDILRGGAGFDTLEGGRGNDILEGGSQDDALAGQENDDILRGDAGDDALDGGSGNDVLQGGIGVDTLLGGEGDDVLEGGAGADVLDGGLGNYDVASYANSGSGLIIDMVNPAASTGDAAGDTYIDIEEVRGTRFNDTIIGDGLDNVLVGGGGSDLLDGGAGNDVLYDNAGSNDVLTGGAGIDQAVFLGRSSTDFTNPFTSIDAFGNGILVETAASAADTLSGIEQLIFDDGIWSVVTQEWVPLIGLSVIGVPEPTLEVGGLSLDGNQVNSTVVLDDTVIDPINGIYVADLDIVDPDGISGGAGALRNVFLTGPDAAAFIISPDGTELRFVGSAVPGVKKVNFEFQERYHVTVNVADASGGSAMNFTLNITDVNDNAPLFTSPDRIVVGAETDTSKVIYRATASDLDTVADVDTAALGAPFEFSLVAPGEGNNNDLFTMSNNGEVRFASAPIPGTYTLQVQAFDGVNTTTENVTVTVAGVLSSGLFTTGDDVVNLNDHDLSTYTLAAATDALDGNDTVILSDTQNVGVPFSGGAGNDTIRGGTGNDVIDGGDGLDTALYSGHNSNFAVTAYNDDGSIVYTDTKPDDGDLGSDTLSGIERIRNDINGQVNGIWEVQLGTAGDDVLVSQENAWDIMNGGAGNDTITGGTGNDWLGGASGDDTIDGAAGNDTIDGGAGNDSLAGGSGNDTIRGGTGNDVIDGGDGLDTALYSGHNSNFAVTAYNDDGSIVYTDTKPDDGDLGSDTLSGIERIRNDINGQVNGIWEVQLGTAGDDVLVSQDNAWDIMNGGAGDDTITGGTGNDWIGGASGDDVINGGLGKDTLTGGAGADTFVFNSALSAANVDTITDFEVGIDTISLDNSIFTVLTDGSLQAGQFAFSTAVDADSRIIYDATIGALLYDEDGDGGAAAQQFAQLQAGLALTENDFIVA